MPWPLIVAGAGLAADQIFNKGRVTNSITNSLDPTKSGAAREFQQVDPYGTVEAERNLASTMANAGRNDFWSTGGTLDNYYKRALSGQENTLSAEMLRQGLQQNRAAQMSYAAGARPGNAAMAARVAATNMGRLGAGLAGQQAMANIAERQAAAQGLQGMRQQNLAAALGGREQAINAGLGVEGARTQRYGAALGVPTAGQSILNAGMGAAALMATKSDIRAKEDIRAGDFAAEQLLEGLKAYEYKYKPEAEVSARRDSILNARQMNRRRDDILAARTGRMAMPTVDLRGEDRLGIMAQDLEKTPLGAQAVVDTPTGKSIDPGQLAVGLAAGMANLHKRLKGLEGRGEVDVEIGKPRIRPLVDVQIGKPRITRSR